MSKKNNIINNIPQEKILVEDQEPEQVQQQQQLTKPKRPVSDAQREHLNNIRAKALEKKAQMKEETLKAKLAKTIEKKELAKKYDEYTEKQPEINKEKEITKPKKEKKIVYKLAESSSSDSSESESEEIVYVKKIKEKKNNKKQIYHKPQEHETLDSTLYKSSQEMLHNRAIEERVRANLVRWDNAMLPREY